MHIRKTLKASLALAALALGGLAPTAHADEAALSLLEIAPATSAFGLCFGLTLATTADVHPSPGDEILTVRKQITLRSDGDGDQNRVLSHLVSVIVKSSSTRATLYETAPMAVNSRDIVVAVGNAGFQFNTLFNPGSLARFGILFPFGTECSGLTVATHNGQPYIVLVAGTSAIDGTPDDPSDQSRFRARVSRGSDGATMRTTSIYAQSNNFIIPSLTTVSDLDDDGNQELLVWRKTAINRSSLVAGFMRHTRSS